MKAVILLISGIFVLSSQAFAQVEWGISENRLQTLFKVQKVTDDSGHGHGYSDFTEVNPVVYVDSNSQDRKIEYYFHKGKLYKTYTIYLKQSRADLFYADKIKEMKKSLGEPSKVFEDELFSMNIKHHVWESPDELLDLRFGAGYVYEVRTDKSLAKDKQIEFDLKHAI